MQFQSEQNKHNDNDKQGILESIKENIQHCLSEWYCLAYLFIASLFNSHVILIAYNDSLLFYRIRF
jgi:hypothetical protein